VTSAWFGLVQASDVWVAGVTMSAFVLWTLALHLLAD